jgi:F420-dependent oxidoreductase-like protein
VLVGPSGAGKSAWAAANFRDSQIVASDDLRALVGESSDDQRAGTDAFAVLDLVVERRLARRLLTVIDTLGLDAARRAQYLAMARRHNLPCHAVVFDTPADVCRSRNRERARPVPATVLSAQLKSVKTAGAAVEGEGFDGVHAPDAVAVVPEDMVHASAAAARQQETPLPLRFGLQIPNFGFADTDDMAGRLAEIAHRAEDAGFTSLWVMDHFLQIPQVGREWEPMLESYTTLGFLAAHTARVRIGTLVTGVTYRNLAHLGKIVASLDVLSGGRAICGIGAAWFGREHAAYGWPFPPVAQRYALLEDALELLPMLWGKGSPSFSGRTIEVAEAMCYPRPLQEHIPILVGGGGEKRTLKLAAQYADACNLFGDATSVAHKLDVLARHCAVIDRDPATIQVTHLSTALVGRDRDEVTKKVERLRPRNQSPEAYAARTSAGTVDDHIGRFRELAEAGVQTAIVNMPDVGDDDALTTFAPVIAAFARDAHAPF